MTDLRKAAEMALDYIRREGWTNPQGKEVWIALRQALAQPEQEASSWRVRVNEAGWCEVIEYGPAPDDQKITPIYTTPPKREWVGLTDEEVEAWRGNYDFFDSGLVREVEAKLKEKNT